MAFFVSISTAHKCVKVSLITFVIINEYTKHQTYSMYVEDMMCMFRQKCISTTRSRKIAKLYDQKSCNTNKDLYWPFVEMTLFRPISNVTMFWHKKIQCLLYISHCDPYNQLENYAKGKWSCTILLSIMLKTKHFCWPVICKCKWRETNCHCFRAWLKWIVFFSPKMSQKFWFSAWSIILTMCHYILRLSIR